MQTLSSKLMKSNRTVWPKTAKTASTRAMGTAHVQRRCRRDSDASEAFDVSGQFVMVGESCRVGTAHQNPPCLGGPCPPYYFPPALSPPTPATQSRGFSDP